MGKRIVCIGGSAGSLTVLPAILGRLRPPVPVPIVVVVHRSVATRAGLDPVLRGGCPLPLREIDDLDDIEPGVVHIAPAAYNTLIDDGVFVLSVEPRDHYSVPSINAMFQTAAAAYGSGVMAVVLSCANADGAVGIEAVRRRGGTVVVQDRSTASHPVLIDAVVRPGDRVLKPAAIGDAVLAWAQS